MLFLFWWVFTWASFWGWVWNPWGRVGGLGGTAWLVKLKSWPWDQAGAKRPPRLLGYCPTISSWWYWLLFISLRTVLFFKVLKINTPGGGDQERNSLRKQSALYLSWFFFWPFFQTARPLVQVPGDTDSDCWRTFLPERRHWSCKHCSRHSGACTTQELCQRLFSERSHTSFFDFQF